MLDRELFEWLCYVGVGVCALLVHSALMALR
jgi:hypothetical protein